jgi:hypothetical protein
MPKSKKGGGTGRVDLQRPHLVNFAIALMAADTITQAAAVVPVYRSLILVEKTSITTERIGDEVITRSRTLRRMRPERTTILTSAGEPPLWVDPPDVDLGEALENILQRYDPRIEAAIKECVAWRSRPWVEITFRTGPNETETHAFGPAPDLFTGLSTYSTRTRPPGACFAMPVEVFKILAKLARDAERDLGPKPSSDAAGKAAAEAPETATPAQDVTGPASVDMASQPGANPVDLAEVTSQQDSGEKERGQRPPPSSHGSPSSDPSDRPKDEPWPRSNLQMQSAG